MHASKEFLESGRDQGKGIREFDHLRVQTVVVNTRHQAPVLLTHAEETRGRRRAGWSDESLVKSLLDVLLQSLALWDGQWIDSALKEIDSRQHVDGTVPWLMRWLLGGCLLAENILECHIIRWDGGSYTGLGTLDLYGGDLDGWCLVE